MVRESNGKFEVDEMCSCIISREEIVKDFHEVMCNGCGKIVSYTQAKVRLENKYSDGVMNTRTKVNYKVHCYRWANFQYQCCPLCKDVFWFFELCPEAGINGFPIKRVSSNV